MVALVCPGLIGALLLAQAGGVSTQGAAVSASDTDGHAFFMTGLDPTADAWSSNLGTVAITAEDRVQLPAATYGDQATLHAEVRDGGDLWALDLTTPGFPPDASGASSPLRAWVRFPIFGGVVTGADLQGFTGMGLLRGPKVHAAAAIWGEGTVHLNGQLVTDHALIEADALSAGGHADDQSFRTLPAAREGDAEIIVFASNLPTALAPRGFLLVGFDNVQISVGGQAVATQLSIPSTGTAASGLPPAATGPLSPVGMPLGVGGSGVAGISPPAFGGEGGLTGPGAPTTPTVLNNGANVTAAPSTPPPLNSAPATALPQTPSPTSAATPVPAPATPAPGNAGPATPAVTTPAPANAGAATSLPTTPAPANAAPATPLPTTPAPVNPAPAPAPAPAP